MQTNKSVKIAFYLFVLGLVTLIVTILRNPVKQEYTTTEVLGSSTNLSFFVEPDDGLDPVLSQLQSAQKEILVEVYLLSDPTVIAKLKEKDLLGAQVKVMLEEHPFGGAGLNQKTKPDLESAGVEVRWTNPYFSLTHEKAFVIDGQIVCILNMNLTKSAFTSNREYNLCSVDQTLASEVKNIFTADWNRTGYQSNVTNLVVSPDNARGKITALIKSATYSLDIVMEAATDPEIINLLTQMSQKIPVRVIFPTITKMKANEPTVNQLRSAGALVKTLGSPYPHAKLIIADQSRGYLGSVNFTSQSLDRNRELGLLFSQADAVERFRNIFESDWQKATSL